MNGFEHLHQVAPHNPDLTRQRLDPLQSIRRQGRANIHRGANQAAHQLGLANAKQIGRALQCIEFHIGQNHTKRALTILISAVPHHSRSRPFICNYNAYSAIPPARHRVSTLWFDQQTGILSIIDK